jgi:8-oxo-dGTP diphosphatase
VDKTTHNGQRTTNKVKRKGCSILFVNDLGQILLFLRDDKPEIPFPNMWDVPGGHVEHGESPEQGIVREMKEEMGLDLDGFEVFSIKTLSDRIEYTYWKKANLNINDIHLTEGQRLKWFTAEEASKTELCYGFNEIVEEFFLRAPFLAIP